MTIEKISSVQDWFTAKEAEAIGDGKGQIRSIFFLVVVGLIAVISLDIVIERVNRSVFDIYAPSETLETSQKALSKLEKNIELIKARNNDLGKSIESLKSTVVDYDAEISENSVLVAEHFDSNLPLWKQGEFSEEWRPNLNQSIELSAIRILDSGMALAVGKSSSRAIVLTSDDYEKWHVAFEADQNLEGSEINSIQISPNGAIILSGSYGFKKIPLILFSQNGASFSYRELSDLSSQGQIEGMVGVPQENAALAVFSDGTFLHLAVKNSDLEIGSWENPAFTIDEGEEIISLSGSNFGELAHIYSATEKLNEYSSVTIGNLYSSKDGNSWQKFTIFEGEDTQIFGTLRESPDSFLFVGGLEAMDANEPLVYRLSDTNNWEEFSIGGLPPTGCGSWTPFDFGQLSDGTNVMIATSCWTNFGLVTGTDWSTWETETLKQEFFSFFRALAVGPNDRVILVGPGLPITSVPALNADKFQKDALVGKIGAVASDFILPNNIKNAIERINLLSRSRTDATFEINQSKDQLAISEVQALEQISSVAALSATRDELRKSYEQTQGTRQLVSLATRLSFIALLMYLIQILVRRYRYLQQLAVFYGSRAQAITFLRIREATDGGAKGHTLQEITSAFSPDNISLDPMADPSTNALSAFLGAALKGK